MSAVIAHRCRFAEYVPKAIIAIAFSADGNRMALARYDGDIELWNHGNAEWFAERIIVNKESVRSLLWVRMNGEDRLFSSGLTGNIVEWDLTTSRQKHTSDSYAGPVWGIAVDPANNLLAAACDDGLRLFDISNGDIQFKKSFNKGSGGRLLSVAWSKEGDTLYTGDINGLVRQWKLNSQTSTLTMRLAKVESRCHIWTIVVLQDGSVVTGDSRGVLSVWDPQTTTEIYSRKTHDADILSMSCIIRPNSEIVVLASGVDSTMGSVRRLPNSGPSGYEWSMGGKYRHHKRDVFALAINKKETVASGGVDGSLHFLPLSSLVQAEKHQDLVLCSPLPPRPIVSFSASQRRFLLKDSASVLSVWKAGREIEGIINEHNKEGKIGSAGATVPIEEMPRNLLKIQIKTGEKLISHALSPNGKMIACADTEAVKIFRIDEKKSGRHGFGEDVRFSVQKMEIPNAELAAWVAWVGDDYVVAGGFNGGVQLIDVMNKPSVVATCAPDWTRPAVAWTGVVATSDKYVAAVRAGGVIDLYHIDKSGDQIEFKLHGSIPSPSPASGVSALTFQPNSLRLFGMRQGVHLNKPFFFDVEAMSNYKDKSWVMRTLPVYAYTSIQFDPSDNDRAMLTSPTCIVFLKLSTLSYRANLKQFENVMYSSFSEDGKALYVVERPSADLEAKLPAPLIHHHNYGKS